MLLWVLLNSFCFLLFSYLFWVSLNTMYFDLNCGPGTPIIPSLVWALWNGGFFGESLDDALSNNFPRFQFLVFSNIWTILLHLGILSHGIACALLCSSWLIIVFNNLMCSQVVYFHWSSWMGMYYFCHCHSLWHCFAVIDEHFSDFWFRRRRHYCFDDFYDIQYCPIIRCHGGIIW